MLNDYLKDYDNNASIIDNCKKVLSQNKEILNHVTKVSQTGIEIARKFGVNINKVEIACYLHDISRIIPEDIYIELCENNNIEVLDVERRIPGVLHQKVSKIISEKVFKITDKEILNAIESHTTLRGNPSEIDMIVFIADKLSWDKEYSPPYLENITHILETSLEKACLEYINFRLNNGMVIEPHPMLIDAKRYFESIQKN